MSRHVWLQKSVTKDTALSVFKGLPKCIDRLEECGSELLVYSLESIRQKGGGMFESEAEVMLRARASTANRSEYVITDCTKWFGPHIQLLCPALQIPVTCKQDALIAADWCEEHGQHLACRFLRVIGKEVET